MFTTAHVVGSFSVDDIAAARSFYSETLGLAVREGMMGNLVITFGSGAEAFAYVTPDHRPAGFTILNFVSDDVEKSVDELNAAGVVAKIYGDDDLADMPGNDAKGIMRDEDGVAQIAWFRDPAGNVLAVVTGEDPS
ncbi:MAG: VOC family protein [Burkholderiaceae bacterium]|nr:VOC family protein [Microbacteriaceae bacterium]